MRFSNIDIQRLEKGFRTNFVNSLSGFKSANLIGTISNTQKTNLAVFSSVIHVGANPPAMAILVRTATVERNTYSNIKENGFFTINHIHKDFFRMAHQTSARYSKEISEFDECGFTPEFTDTLPAPYVKEATIKIGLKMVEEHVIQFNQTVFIVGEVLEVLLDDSLIQKDGYIDIEKANTVAITGLDSYHTTQRITRLSYAKPFTQPYDLSE
jgi:flavin reductase (DIM6/NTAB) family NADH-FMN oxidoreductase RutF